MFYRRPGSSFGGALPPGVKLLLIANAAVFVLQVLFDQNRGFMPGPLTQALAFIPQDAVLGLQVWRFFTYMFLHGDFFHIGINMFLLWMFGSQIEARWGRNAFLTYYLICGLGGAATYGVFNLVGMEAGIPMLGASGAVYGILLAYGMIFPEAVILVMMIFPMKAKYAVILFGLIELMASASNSGGGIAHLAHLGGMITGFIFLKLTIPGLRSGVGSPGGGLGAAWRRYRTKQRMRVVRPDERPRGGNGSDRDRTPKTPDQERIDAILDKISREGLDSLTEEEQDILRRGSRK
jgi:membrane associated rhomboid family serine protease